ncbi:MAG: YitT family protein, partial [Intrasporangiaceae bacterium]|nr:YitT family protein [Intrasporangiaceae bacterium]
MPPNHAPRELRRRLPRLLVGLVLCGWGIASMVASGLGLGPWDVLHQGLSVLIGIPIGTMGILVGILVLALWFPLHERPGLGTVLNVLVIGIVIDVTLLW